MELFQKNYPLHIDIYIDGSLLTKSRRNPAPAAGWGAVIIETYENGKREAWLPSGPCLIGGDNSSKIEEEAAKMALQAVLTREEYRASKLKLNFSITVHTDQIHWVHIEEKLRKTPDISPKEKHKELFSMIRDIIAAGGNIVYKSHNKNLDSTGRSKPTDDSMMAIADKLAERESIALRLEKQGFIYSKKEKKHPMPNESNEEFLNRLYFSNINIGNSL